MPKLIAFPTLNAKRALKAEKRTYLLASTTIQCNARAKKLILMQLSTEVSRGGSISREVLGESFKWAVLKYTLNK